MSRRSGERAGDTVKAAWPDTEVVLITRALMREFGGKVALAAERAGMERESLHRVLRRHRLRAQDFKRAW